VAGAIEQGDSPADAAALAQTCAQVYDDSIALGNDARDADLAATAAQNAGLAELQQGGDIAQAQAAALAAGDATNEGYDYWAVDAAAAAAAAAVEAHTDPVAAGTVAAEIAENLGPGDTSAAAVAAAGAAATQYGEYTAEIAGDAAAQAWLNGHSDLAGAAIKAGASAAAAAAAGDAAVAAYEQGGDPVAAASVAQDGDQLFTLARSSPPTWPLGRGRARRVAAALLVGHRADHQRTALNLLAHQRELRLVLLLGPLPRRLRRPTALHGHRSPSLPAQSEVDREIARRRQEPHGG
jgi:hypothetical protein